MRRLSTPVFAAVLVLALIPLVALALWSGPNPAASPAPIHAAAATSGAQGSSASIPPDGSQSASDSASASGSPDDSPSTIPGTIATVPIVPVTDFRTTVTTVTAVDLRAVLAGTDPRWSTLELVASDADGILAALATAGAPAPTGSTRIVRAKSYTVLAKDLAKDSKRLAVVRATQVTPAVRALGWGTKALFGVDRVTTATGWKLNAQLDADVHPFNPGKTWTIVAGGDILLDRGVYKQIQLLGKGADFPFNGGTARIVSRHCCSSFGWPVPTGKRTGSAGLVRHLLVNADIAVANFENPAPNNPHYHTQGTVFTADPRFIVGLKDAGIDVVSIANNHIGDAGRAGVIQTVANLDKYGIKHAGAGKNSAAAHKAAFLTVVGGVKVAILGYDSIAGYYAAGVSTPGSAHLTAAGVKKDVAAARAAGADVVIVYPHWGTEYDPTPFAGQKSLAHAIIDSGADMVIGNHAHWVGAMEVYKGHPIWYALGNFVFDQVWSEPTQEGLILELTFSGKHVVQARLRPTLILDHAQPNLLDPAGDGRVVLGQLYDASKGLLPW